MAVEFGSGYKAIVKAIAEGYNSGKAVAYELKGVGGQCYICNKPLDAVRTEVILDEHIFGKDHNHDNVNGVYYMHASCLADISDKCPKLDDLEDEC